VNKLWSVLGTVLAIAGIAALVYLKWWNVFGQAKLGEPCEGRAGCRSFYCLKHERVGSAEPVSGGYCTASCDSDADCTTGLHCVVPSAIALDDLPSHGRPNKLCERAR
jgi:hypothetical protein